MSTTYRVLSDQLYRSVALVTTANVVTEAYDTDAYGNTLCYSGPGTDSDWFTDDDVQTHNPINTTIFTGRQYDFESQIYYYRVRYYSPQIGRFISRDPLTNAELSQGPNLYRYVKNCPVNSADPLGLQQLSPLQGDCCANRDQACVKAVSDLWDTARSIEEDNDDIQKLTQQIESLGGSALGDFFTGAGADAAINGIADAASLGLGPLGLGIPIYDLYNNISTINQIQSLEGIISNLKKNRANLIAQGKTQLSPADQAFSALKSCVSFYHKNFADTHCSDLQDEYELARKYIMQHG